MIAENGRTIFVLKQIQVTSACAREGWPANPAHHVDDSNGPAAFYLTVVKETAFGAQKQSTIRNQVRKKKKRRTAANVEEEEIRRGGVVRKKGGEDDRRKGVRE